MINSESNRVASNFGTNCTMVFLGILFAVFFIFFSRAEARTIDFEDLSSPDGFRTQDQSYTTVSYNGYEWPARTWVFGNDFLTNYVWCLDGNFSAYKTTQDGIILSKPIGYFNLDSIMMSSPIANQSITLVGLSDGKELYRVQMEVLHPYLSANNVLINGPQNFSLGFLGIDSLAIYTQSQLVFDKIVVTNETPLPAAAILLGTGLICLVGLRRKCGRAN